MMQGTFPGHRTSQPAKRCPDCGTATCTPLFLFGYRIRNRFLCTCGRIVDRFGHRIVQRRATL